MRKYIYVYVYLVGRQRTYIDHSHCGLLVYIAQVSASLSSSSGISNWLSGGSCEGLDHSSRIAHLLRLKCRIICVSLSEGIVVERCRILVRPELLVCQLWILWLWIWHG